MTSTSTLAGAALALLLAAPARRAAAQEAPARVDEVRFEPPGLLSPSDARGLLALPLPGPADATGIERTRTNLLATGRFVSAEPRLGVEKGRGVLTFRLDPRRFVRRVDVEGARQIPRRTIASRIDLQAWRPFSEEAVAGLPAQVAGVYERAGFPPPKVEVEVSPPDPKGASVVLLRVTETRLPKLAAFETDLPGLPWHTGLPTRAKLLVLEARTKLSGVNQKRLDAAAKKEQKRLRELGWKGAQLRIADEPSASGDGSRTVRVALDLGPREKLKGEQIDRPVMREVSETWKRRNVPLTDGVVNRLARAAAEGMRERGYLDVAVAPSTTQEGERKVVVLAATHGERTFVESVRFEGNASLPAEQLLAAAVVYTPRLLRLDRSRPGPETLEAGRQAVAELYVRSGFPESAVAVRLEGEAPALTVVFTVTEGPRRRISSLAFPGAAAVPEKRLRQIARLSDGSPYWVEGAEKAAERILTEYSRLGYDEAKVTPRWGAPDAEGGVPLRLEIAEGETHSLGPSIVRGNFKTRARRLLALGDEERGKPADAVALAEHQTRLSRLGLFDTVSVKAEKLPGGASGEKAVVVAVTERPTGYLEWGVDLNTDFGVELATTLGERNLFGQAVSGSVSTILGTERQNVSVEMGQPVLFGLRLYNGVQASYTSDATYEGFTLATIAVGAGLSWEFDEKRRVTLNYKLERQTPIRVEPDVDQALTPEEVRIGSLTPAVTLDGRDDPFVPTKGTFLLGRVKVSRQFLGGQVDYERWEIDTRWYRTRRRGPTVATALRIGVASTREGEELPVGERFFVGGANTHRGFKENELGPRGSDGSPLGGESYVLGNAEVRFPIYGPVEGGVFVDVGNAYLGGIDLGDLRWGLGGGLRLKTPVGPLRFDVGLKLGKKEGEDAYALHLALGHAF